MKGRRRLAFLPRKKDGYLVNAVLLVAHKPDCEMRAAVSAFNVSFWPGMFDEERIEYRDGAGRHREPMNGGREWVKFQCGRGGCPAVVSIRLGALERAASDLILSDMGEHLRMEGGLP